jgi:hypothetical protein
MPAAVIEWFGKAKEAIRDKFGQTIPTLTEDLQLVRNTAERFFGEAAVGSGAMAGLANAARYFAEHFEGIAKVAIIWPGVRPIVVKSATIEVTLPLTSIPISPMPPRDPATSTVAT